MATYVPSGKAGGAGLAMTLGAAAASGVVIAVAAHFIGRFFYLLILFPLLWGLGVGFAASWGVRMGKCRNVTFAAMAAILGATVSYGTYHALENWHIRTQVKAAIQQEGADPESYDEYMKQEYGSTGFSAEMKMRAAMGMSIGRTGRGGDSKPMITGVGMYGYWLLELGIIAVIAFLPTVARAKSAFCEPCLAWYERGPALGIDVGKAPRAAAALDQNDWAGFAACAGSGAVLSLEKCPACDKTPISIVLETVVTDGKGKETRSKVHESLLARADANALLAAMAGKSEDRSPKTEDRKDASPPPPGGKGG